VAVRATGIGTSTHPSPAIGSRIGWSADNKAAAPERWDAASRPTSAGRSNAPARPGAACVKYNSISPAIELFNHPVDDRRIDHPADGSTSSAGVTAELFNDLLDPFSRKKPRSKSHVDSSPPRQPSAQRLAAATDSTDCNRRPRAFGQNVAVALFRQRRDRLKLIVPAQDGHGPQPAPTSLVCAKVPCQHRLLTETPRGAVGRRRLMQHGEDRSDVRHHAAFLFRAARNSSTRMIVSSISFLELNRRFDDVTHIVDVTLDLTALAFCAIDLRGGYLAVRLEAS